MVHEELFAAALRIADEAPRDWMAIPRQVEIDGQSYATVTDGYSILFLRAVDAAPMDQEPAPALTTDVYIRGLLTENYPNSDHVPLSEIVRWVGTGHECNCEFCGYESATEPCIFYGQPFDRRVLRWALPRLDETVTVEWTGEKLKPLRVTGDDWIVVVMGLRDLSGAGDRPIPTFGATMRVVTP